LDWMIIKMPRSEATVVREKVEHFRVSSDCGESVMVR
jgi:hypothetical protein